MPPTNGLYNYNYMTPNTNFLATKTPHPLGPCRCCWTAITWSPLKILFSNEDFFPLVLPRKKTCTKLVGDFKFPFEQYAPQKLEHFPKSFRVKITRMPRKPQFFFWIIFSHLGTCGSSGILGELLCKRDILVFFVYEVFHSFTLFRPNKKSALKWIRLTWTWGCFLVSHIDISQTFHQGRRQDYCFLAQASCHLSWCVSSHSSPPYLLVPKKTIDTPSFP